MGRSEYFKKWYEANKHTLAEKRASKYRTDPKYKKRVLTSNSRYYKAIKTNKVPQEPVATIGNNAYYSMAQVAQILGVTGNTARKIINNLGIVPQRIGKNVTLTTQQIEQIKTQWQRKPKKIQS